MIYLIEPRLPADQECAPVCKTLCGIKPLYGVPCGAYYW